MCFSQFNGSITWKLTEMGCKGWNAGQLALWEKLCFSQFTGWNAGKVTEKMK